MQTFDEAEVLTILDEAFALPAESRPGFLNDRCGNRQALKERVQELLKNSQATKEFPIFRIEENPQSPAAASTELEEKRHHFKTEASDGSQATRIGPFRLLSVLGEGGMGVVYRAEQSQPQREIALKVLHSRFLEVDGFRRRFEREIELLGRLDHPGIARIFDAGSAAHGDRQIPYIAMEWIDGAPLSQFTEESPLTLPAKLELIAQIADAVHAAHQKSVVHRDLKPANILVNTDGQPKILDFGIATTTDSDIHQAYQTQAGELIGTLAYMSPEQARGDTLQVDARSDIYSLGLIGYEILAGEPAFQIAGQPIAMILEILQRGGPKQLGTFDERYQGDINSIFRKACAPEPSERYGSASAFADDLRRFLSHRPIAARSPSTAYEIRKFIRRNRTAVALSAVALLAILAGGIGSTVGFVKAASSSRLANERALELSTVTEFEGRRLNKIDTASIAASMYSELLNAALNEAPSEQANTRRGMFQELFAGVDFQNISNNLLVTHIFEPALSDIDQEFEGQPRIQANLLQKMATMYRIIGFPKNAITPQDRALRLRSSLDGESSEDILDSTLELGLLQTDQGSYQTAKKTLELAVAMGEEVLDKDDPRRFTAQHHLASVYRLLGELSTAREMQENVIANQTRVLGALDRATMSSVSDLSLWLFYEGNLDRAEEIGRRNLQMQVDQYGEEDRQILASKSKLATVLRGLGNYAEAETLESDVANVRLRTLGKTHPLTVASLGNHAITLEKLELHDRAYLIRERVLDNLVALRGHRHRLTWLAKVNLSASKAKLDQHDEALKLVEEAREGMALALKPDHPDRLTTERAYALRLQSAGQLNDAISIVRGLLDLQIRKLSSDHPSTLRTRMSLVEMLLAKGEIKDASYHGELAVEAHERKFGRDNRSTLHAMRILARSYGLQRKYALACDLYEAVLAKQTMLFGEEDQDLPRCLHDYAVGLVRLKEYKRAFPLFEEAIRRSKALFGATGDQTLARTANFVVALRDAKEYDRSFTLTEKLLVDCRKTLGNENITTLQALMNFSQLHWLTGRQEKASLLMDEAESMANGMPALAKAHKELIQKKALEYRSE